MAYLTVFKFSDAGGAEQMLSTLEKLHEQELIRIIDAATVVWPEDKRKPMTRQIHDLAGTGALNGTFWGMLFGLLFFFMPVLGAAIGAGLGALIGMFSDFGIDDRFINEVRAKVTPGTSALFLMSSEVYLDLIKDAVRGQSFELIASNLSAEQEAKLNAYFSES